MGHRLETFPSCYCLISHEQFEIVLECSDFFSRYEELLKSVSDEVDKHVRAEQLKIDKYYEDRKREAKNQLLTSANLLNLHKKQEDTQLILKASKISITQKMVQENVFTGQKTAEWFLSMNLSFPDFRTLTKTLFLGLIDFLAFQVQRLEELKIRVF